MPRLRSKKYRKTILRHWWSHQGLRKPFLAFVDQKAQGLCFPSHWSCLTLPRPAFVRLVNSEGRTRIRFRNQGFQTFASRNPVSCLIACRKSSVHHSQKKQTICRHGSHPLRRSKTYSQKQFTSEPSALNKAGEPTCITRTQVSINDDQVVRICFPLWCGTRVFRRGIIRQPLKDSTSMMAKIDHRISVIICGFVNKKDRAGKCEWSVLPLIKWSYPFMFSLLVDPP